jgi:hypothetical protein
VAVLSVPLLEHLLISTMQTNSKLQTAPAPMADPTALWQSSIDCTKPMLVPAQLHRRKRDPRFPVLRGFVDRDSRTISVHCPWCDCQHVHGWPPDAPHWTISHRVAHCRRSDSPFDRFGYFIGPFTGLRAEAKKHFAAKQQHQHKAYAPHNALYRRNLRTDVHL